MADNRDIKPLALGLAGAVAGGVAGYLAFFWLTRQGFYSLILPPALVGLGAGLCARGRSVPLAVICCIGGLLLGLFAEWKRAPFVSDASFSYFITHFTNLTPVSLIMLGVGTVLAYRFALGFKRPKQENAPS